MSDKCTEESFLRDVATHELTVIKDEELYRHLRFRRPASGNMYFDLITWPGYLCYTGDMGTYVFSRIPDMFEFFRMGNNDFNKRPEPELSINPGYWSEKVQSTSKFGNDTEEFSVESFKEVILKRFEEHFEEEKPEIDWEEYEPENETPEDVINAHAPDFERWQERKDNCRDEIENHIFCHESYHELYAAADNFDEYGLQFTDLWDHDFNEYTYHFIWCCYALAWGIGKYDELKDAKKS